jgi:peptidoglycan/xylan/chitin deacetylase (PgdA/CDA1 family)
VAVYIPAGRAAPVPNALPGHSDVLTLSFDDCGSAEQIQAVVDSLAAVHRRGLFFITGQCRDHFPWLVGALSAAGHLACNHTYSHPDLRRLSDAAIRWEIGHGVFAGCPYFRPPFGGWDGPRGRIARIAAEFGLSPLLWDVDSRDWAGAPASAIANLAKARGGVILLHLHGATTPEAIRLIG